METKDTDVYTSIPLIYSNYPKELVYSETNTMNTDIILNEIMCKTISDEKEGFQAFDEAIDHLLKTNEWDKNLFPKFNTDTIVGDMASRIILNMYIDTIKIKRKNIYNSKTPTFWIDVWNIYFQTIYDNPNMCQCIDDDCWRKISNYDFHFRDIIIILIKDMVTCQPIKEYDDEMYYETQKFKKITKPIGNYKAFHYNDTNSETSDFIDNDTNSETSDFIDNVNPIISDTKSQQPQPTSNKRSITLKINGVEYEIKLSNPINDNPVDITINDGNSTVTITI